MIGSILYSPTDCWRGVFPMAKLLNLGILIFGGAMVCAMAVCAQDAPSLGDVARQARQQKQQKDGQGKDIPSKDVLPQTKDAAPTKTPANPDTQAKDSASNPQTAKAAKHVFTNDEIPEHIGPTSTRPPGDNNNVNPVVYYPQQSTPAQGAAEQWKAQISSMKGYIANMQAQIAQLEQSVHYAGGNCFSNCVQWNERQKQKQDQAEMMKQQLAEQQKRLEDMQEMARRQGFGSSVYDP